MSLSRECRNCRWGELADIREGKSGSHIYCGGGPPKWGAFRTMAVSDVCKEWRPYTEAEPEIPAGAAMVSVPWDWVRRIEKLETQCELYERQTHQHRFDEGRIGK